VRGGDRRDHGVVYIRGEYPRAIEIMRDAIDEARDRLLPGSTSPSTSAPAATLRRGDALLRGIEGCGRAQPKRPTRERGLHDKPTVVQNVETLSIIPWLCARPAPRHQGVQPVGAVARRARSRRASARRCAR